MSKDNNLIDFLKKRSLFQNSSSKNLVNKIPRSKSRERDDNNSLIDVLNQSPRKKAFTNAKHSFKNQQQINPYQDFFMDTRDTIGLNNIYIEDRKPIIKKTESKVVTQDKRQSRRFSSNQNFKAQNNNFLGMNTSYQVEKSSYVSNFESARVESLQCLDTLSFKLQEEISNINYRIDKITKQISQNLEYQLKKLKQNIINMVNDVFRQTQKSIQFFLKNQLRKITAQTLKIRQVLERQYINVQSMKDQVKTTQWRRITGQILSNDLQNKIGDILKRAASINIGRWEIKDFGSQSLTNLKFELTKLATLQKMNNFR